MIKYEKGQIVKNFICHSEGAYFDMDDSGAVLIIFFNKPTQNEIKQFKAGHNFEIRFTEIEGLIMLTAKIGNLNWMDMPYTPHLSRGLTKLQIPGVGQGLALTLILVDGKSGRIEHIRLMSLNEDFTKSFFDAVKKECSHAFDKQKYVMSLNKIYQKYSTNDIVKRSFKRCMIRGN